MAQVPTPEQVRARAAEVHQRIEAAGGRPGAVTLVAVTKAFPLDHVRVALEAGLLDLGENYAQELAAKAEELARAGEGADCRWHFIGGLQRNKVKLLAGTVTLWHSIDRAALVDEVAKRSPGDRILIQVNTTDEEQKSGCAVVDTPALVERARAAGLVVEGLMTVGPTEPGADPRPAFVTLRETAARCEVEQLSMGMSGDFEIAVEEGATIVRVGTALFGARPPR